MLEHLYPADARTFLAEAYRVLAPSGILRLVVPDLRELITEYERSGDADTFVAETLLAAPKPEGWYGKLYHAVFGDRHHLWMYDSRSLGNLLGEHNFEDIEFLEPGNTLLSNPGELDLNERSSGSLVVEAKKPS